MRIALAAAALVLVVVAGVVLLRRPRAPEESAYRSNNLGVAQLEQLDYDAAVQSFRSALAIDPDLAMARINVAIALLHASRIEEAEAEARAAVQARPDSPHAQYVLGLVLRDRGQLDEAIAAFTRVAAIDARDPGTSVNVGQILQQQRQFPEAVSHFASAVEVEPYNVTAAYGLATALARAGRAEESAAAMARFQTLRTSPYGTTYSQTYLEQGRYAEAVASTGLERELIDASIPPVSYVDASARIGALAPGPCQSMDLRDLDGDHDLDLALLCGDAVRFLHNDGGRFALRSEHRLVDTAPTVLATGDFNNDGRTDVFVAGERAHRVLGQQADGSYADLATGGLPPATGRPRALACVDIDHDGDLDVVIGNRLQLLRNNGNNTFSDTTSEAGLQDPGVPVQAIVPTDFDDRRDIDLLVVADGAPPVLYRNLRDGRFRDVAADVGLPPADAYSAVAAGDINKDALPDFFFGRGPKPGLVAMSRGVDRFQLVDAPATTAGTSAAMLVDYDNDGLLDLLTSTAAGPRLSRFVGERWIDATDRAFAPLLRSDPDPIAQIVMGDLDDDGTTDAIVRLASGQVRVLRNEGGSGNRSLRVRLTPRVSNTSAAGAKIDLRAGSLRQRLELSSTTPASRPADLVFGLGRRSAADVVRVIWPAGILQAERALADPLTIVELDRKPSSCPLLFTWNGVRYEFVSDFLGGGEMGLWVGPSPGGVAGTTQAATWNRPDPDEYVRIRDDQLRPLNGRYEIRITNELEEAVFIDRLELVAVDHARAVSVFPNEGLTAVPKPFRLFAAVSPTPPVGAVDDHGHDMRPALAALDRRYADDFEPSPIRGYAAAHSLTLDLGVDANTAVLLLTGWTDYAFSSDNVAAHQAGITMRAPLLQVRDGTGAWRTIIEDIGFPVGRPQTIPVDLRGLVPGGSREVRIVTNMRVYWDQILVDTSGGSSATRETRSGPSAAVLAWRGFSMPVSGDGREPHGYDYSRVTGASPWKTLVGAYTREGDVRPLVHDSDDMFVIAMPGDQIAVAFDIAAFPPLAPDRTRTFLLYADGFSKEMNPRSATPDRLGPLPFHRMTRYPYGSDEAYPSTPAHRESLMRYQTRLIRTAVPPIETHDARGASSKLRP